MVHVVKEFLKSICVYCCDFFLKYGVKQWK